LIAELFLTEPVSPVCQQGMGGGAPGGVPQQAAPVKLEPMGGAGGGAGGAQNGAADYSAQWAEYYRSIGKVKEAEAIEAQMKGPKVRGGGNIVHTWQLP
jgi:far upstream element-binding protein